MQTTHIFKKINDQNREKVKINNLYINNSKTIQL